MNDLLGIGDSVSFVQYIFLVAGRRLIIYRINSENFLVVLNASNREKDLEWIAQNISSQLPSTFALKTSVTEQSFLHCKEH